MKVFTSSHKVDPVKWEAIRDTENLFTDLRYLKAVEEANILDCEHQFFEFSRDGKLLCSIYGFILINDFASYLNKPWLNIINSIRKAFPDFMKIKSLEIGTPINFGLTISLDSQIRDDQLISIISLIKRYARKQNVNLVLIRDFRGQTLPIENHLILSGFSKLANLPNAILKLRWKSFEEYTADMKSMYRRNVKVKKRQKEKAQIQTIICKGKQSLKLVDDYVSLYKNVRKNSDFFSREFYGKEFHHAMYNNLNEFSYWLQYYKNSKLVAFFHFFVYKGKTVLNILGMDYQVSFEAMLYFNSYFDWIQYSIDHNIHSYDAGTTTFIAKSSLGFSIVPQRMYLWMSNPIFLWAVKTGYRHSMDMGIKNVRRAFKEEGYQYLWDGDQDNL